MTREQMINLLIGEDAWPNPDEETEVAAQLKADGETIERLTKERQSHAHETEIHRLALAQVKETMNTLELVVSQRDAALARVAMLETLVNLDQGGCVDRQMLPTLADYQHKTEELGKRYQRIKELEVRVAVLDEVLGASVDVLDKACLFVDGVPMLGQPPHVVEIVRRAREALKGSAS